MVSPPLHSIMIIGVQQGQTALQCLIVWVLTVQLRFSQCLVGVNTKCRCQT